MAAAIPSLHRLLQPWLSRLRPLVSPVVEVLPRRRLAAAVNVADIRNCARARAHRMIFGYLDAGADDEIALRRSNEAFAALELHYHVSSCVRALGVSVAAPKAAQAHTRATAAVRATALGCVASGAGRQPSHAKLLVSPPRTASRPVDLTLRAASRAALLHSACGRQPDVPL